nr:MAG TPA: hypothetical protein [Caudoviricetes sp.]
MDIKNAKVGMRVRLNKNAPNGFLLAAEKSCWIGEITWVGDTFISVATILTNGGYGKKFTMVEPRYFKKAKKNSKSDIEYIDLKVVRVGKQYGVLYKGSLEATACCGEKDEFNAEFGLNLALRRFCKKLCNKNTVTQKKVVKTVINVEDLI